MNSTHYVPMLFMRMASVFFLLSSSLAIAQDCGNLDAVRKNGANNFSKILSKEAEQDGKFLATFLLPGARECNVDVYSSAESKYYCEWVVGRERSAQEKAKAAFNAYVATVSQCAGSTEHISRESRKDREWAYFPDKKFRENGKSAWIRIEYSYFSPWWLVEFNYLIEAKE